MCHLFFSCKISSQLWKMCDKWFDVHSVHHCRTIEHFMGLLTVGAYGKRDMYERHSVGYHDLLYFET